MRNIFFALVLGALTPVLVGAHTFNYGNTQAHLHIEGNTAQVEITAPALITYEDSDAPAEGDPWEHYIQTRLLISNKAIPCYFALNSFSQNAESETTHFSGVYTCTEAIASLDDVSIKSFLFRSHFEDSEVTMMITQSGARYRLFFTERTNNFPTEVHAQPYSSFDMYREYATDGFNHIIYGPDHLLFLIIIFLGLTRLVSALIAVTVFAVAHSITFFLTVYGVLTLDAYFVEAGIAATIAIAGFLTAGAFWFSREDRLEQGRLWVIFILGLIHGLGFGGDLRDAAIPADTFLQSLISFTLGIEAGQIVVLIITLPLILLARKYLPYRITLSLLAGCIACIAFYMTITRLL